ncbi:MAG: OmpA family protein, partial [Elusimicrobiota bacterium]
PEKVSIELKVLFDTAKHDVKPEFHAEIQRVADFMKSYPDTKAEIEGHTDNQGEADYNRGLSQRRADAVRQVLIDNFDIPADRLTAKGYGPDQPIADNGTEEGRTRNRRVVAILTATKR